MARRLRMMLLVFVGLTGCSPLLGFPDVVSENALQTCQDGRDNDLDGDIDCDDADCGCNRCEEFVSEPLTFDVLGQICNESCECMVPIGEVDRLCNLEAKKVDGAILRSISRCAPVPTPGEDEFDISFLIEVAPDPTNPTIEVTTGAGNVFGQARFDGETANIVSAQWDGFSGLEFRGPPDDGQQAVLFLFRFQLPQPDPFEKSVIVISDVLSPDAERTGVLSADFGPVPTGGDPSGLRQNQVAVIQTATLTYQPLSDTPEGYWAGHFQGRLRNATAFDRTTCGGDLVFDADIGTCRVPAFDEVLIYLACAYSEAPRPGFGEIQWSWKPWWASAIERGNGGECAARREGDVVRIRAVVDRGGLGPQNVSRPWILEIVVPRFRVSDVAGLALDNAGMWQTTVGDDPTPLLDIDLGPPDRSLSGSLRIDDQNFGPGGRFFGWIRAEVAGPP